MDFYEAIAHIIELEGGYVNDPRDPGGETKYGISKRAYPDEDIKNLTVERARDIYRRDYWDKIRGNDLPQRMAYYMLDAAINQGVKASITMLQEVLKVKVDGVIGPMTIKAANSGNPELPALYMARRAIRYANTNNFNVYGNGWMKRLFLVAEYNGAGGTIS